MMPPKLFKFFIFLFIIFLAKFTGSLMVMNLITAIFAVLIIRFKRDYLFWFTFAYVYAQNPLSLFFNYSFGLNLGFQIIDFSQIIIIVLFLTTIKFPKVYFIFYRKYLWFTIPVIALGFIMGFAYDINLRIFFRTLKLLVPWLFIPVAIRCLRDENHFQVFFKYIFLFVFISFAGHLIVYTTGTPPSVLFFGFENEYQEGAFGVIDTATELSRYDFSLLLLGLSMMGAMFYSMQKKPPFNKNYLNLVIIIAYISVILTGSRGWSLGFGFLLLSWLVLNIQRIGSFFRYVLLGMVFFVFVLPLMPSVSNQLSLAFERISTVKKIGEGDITAGGTVSRFDDRVPRLMTQYRKTSAIFGAGYSSFYYEHSDRHIGHHDVLFLSGIFGFLVLNAFILFVIFKGLIVFLSTANENSYAMVFGSAFLFSLYLIHTTRLIYSYLSMPPESTTIAVVLAFMAFYYHRIKVFRFFHSRKDYRPV